jgi:predicted nucleotidyltransferase/DNA-binding MarR family transcriptional regulator
MLQKSSVLKTMGVFFNSPTKEFTLKDISRLSKLAHTSTYKNIQELIKKGLVKKMVEKKGKRKFPLYKGIRSQTFLREKRLYNLQALEDSGLIFYLEDNIMPNCIVLFGSYLRGEDTEQSDIDIFIESKEKKVNLKPFEKKLQHSIELHFTSNFKKYSSELKNNIINGSVLHGFLEGYP